MTRRPILATALLLALAPALATAQDAGTPPDSTERIVDRTFTLPQNEFARLWFAGGETYRIEIDGTGIPFQLRPVDEANEPPLIKPLLLGRSASGTALYTIQVRDPGYYTLRSSGGERGRAVIVRIVHDTSAWRSTTTRSGS